LSPLITSTPPRDRRPDVIDLIAPVVDLGAGD
jgi:hypothetical protein